MRKNKFLELRQDPFLTHLQNPLVMPTWHMNGIFDHMTNQVKGSLKYPLLFKGSSIDAIYNCGYISVKKTNDHSNMLYAVNNERRKYNINTQRRQNR